MATYAPAIVNNATAPLQVSGTGGVSYDQILNSLGDFNFLVEQIYLSASSMQQILQNIGFQKFDATGNLDGQQIVPSPDPYQKVPAIYLDTKGKKVILDGRSNMYLDILTAEIITLILFCDQTDVRQQLESFSKTKAVQNEVQL